MNDLQILILTLFMGLFGLLINYLVKFFRSAAKSAEETRANANETDISHNNQQVILFKIFGGKSNRNYMCPVFIPH